MRSVSVNRRCVRSSWMRRNRNNETLNTCNYGCTPFDRRWNRRSVLFTKKFRRDILLPSTKQSRFIGCNRRSSCTRANIFADGQRCGTGLSRRNGLCHSRSGPGDTAEPATKIRIAAVAGEPVAFFRTANPRRQRPLRRGPACRRTIAVVVRVSRCAKQFVQVARIRRSSAAVPR